MLFVLNLKGFPYISAFVEWFDTIYYTLLSSKGISMISMDLNIAQHNMNLE